MSGEPGDPTKLSGEKFFFEPVPRDQSQLERAYAILESRRLEQLAQLATEEAARMNEEGIKDAYSHTKQVEGFGTVPDDPWVRANNLLRIRELLDDHNRVEEEAAKMRAEGIDPYSHVIHPDGRVISDTVYDRVKRQKEVEKMLQISGIMAEQGGGGKVDYDVKFHQEVVPAAKAEAGSTEKKVEKVDRIFDELLDRVKDRPEAEKEALRVLVEEMKAIAIQMKTVRDARNLQELKELMLTNWNKLNEMTQRDPALLQEIQTWGERFNDEKVIYYDRINEVKEKLTGQAREIDSRWTGMTVDMGKVIGEVENLHPGMLGEVQRILYPREMNLGILEGGDISGWIREASGLKKFVESLNGVDTGFEEGDINLDSVRAFVENLNKVLTMLSAKAFENGTGGVSPNQQYPGLEDQLRGVATLARELTEQINEASNIYRMTKTIRDTQFLDVYNSQPGVE